MERVQRLHPDLDEQVIAWREGRPDGSLEAAVVDLRLWRKPGDENAQWLVWQALRRAGDPAALEGFEAMRATARQLACRPGRTAAMAGPYDPLPELILYFASSLRTRTKAAGWARTQLMRELGITSDMTAREAAERVRQAVEQARDEQNLRAEAAEAGDGS